MQAETSQPAPLVGLIGAAGAGKSTVAKWLELHHGFYHLAFADPLRDMVHALFAATGVADCWATERALKEQPCPLGPSYRELMQTLGTEWGRHTMGSGFWVRALEQRLSAPELKGSPVVVSDVRFANEAEALRKRGGVLVRVLRDVAAVRSHESEAGAATLVADLELHNHGSVVTLTDQVSALVERLAVEHQQAEGILPPAA